MIYRWLTDVTVTIHFAFLVFVVVGGVVARRHRWLRVPHLAAVVWAIYVEATPGLVCPLTPLENYFAARAGLAGYEGSFIEHYLAPIIYPDGLTPIAQYGLAAFVLAINLTVYAWSPLRRHVRRRVQRTVPIRLGERLDGGAVEQ
jgi:Protein of Unknown function (DUF2784)